MKVAFDYSIFMIQKYGGVSRYFLKLYKEINKVVNCKIIAPLSIKSHTKEINENFYNLIRINEIPSFGTKININLNYTASSIYMKCWKPNIIHKTYFNDHKYKFIDAKKILNVWDLTHEIYPELYNKSKDWRPKQKSLDLTDHVICSSYKTRDDLKKYYNFDLNKTSVVYQGIDEEKNQKMISFNKKKILLYVGSRLKYKNFENLLRALSINKKILHDFQLVCFGEEKNNFFEKKLIKNLKLNEENIFFISGDNSKLKSYYLKSTALIYPSKNEGFGFPPLEAMSFGCPVITSNNTAILEATNLAEYTFDPESPQDIALKLENIIYSKDSIDYLINHGLTRVKQFSWEKTSNQILEIYNNLLD